MDVAKPVGSEITHLDFSVLTPDEIRKLSAKQITNPTAFDNLGHPVPGGLYDLALGGFLRNTCATCGLDEKFCPGHQGHIELPVPVYNPLFFTQMFLMLRSSCVYCHHFKMKSVDCHAYECRLRLIQYGLILEASQIEGIQLDGTELPDDEAEEVDGMFNRMSTVAEEQLKEKRELFVYESINKALKDGRTTGHGVYTGTTLEARKETIKELYHRMLSRPRCENCGMYSPTYRNDGYSKIFENGLTEKQQVANRIKGLKRKDGFSASSGKGSRYVLSSEVEGTLVGTFVAEQPLVNVVFHSRPSKAIVKGDMFFLKAMVVPATRFRLPQKLGDEVHENAQNELLANVLRTTMLIKDLNERFLGLQKDISAEEKKLVFNRLMNAFVTLQNDVNGFIDSTKNQNPGVARPPLPGVKQALEKKEGLFRKHMMGKRVNYAARSVISPDPNIETSEIGLPPVFATKLTYPEPVTAFNAAELRKAIINGPDKWPGATQVRNEDGTIVSLEGMNEEQRQAVARQLQTPSGDAAGVINKQVFRHIKNGDIVIMNRQPTLHKASMMGHRVRVLPGEKTIRIHYANGGAYNCDYDGDEMNMHFPQSQQARAEAYNLANTDSQYLTPTAGAPVRGLIQDHLSAGVWMTNKDTMFTREKYYELVYGSLRPAPGANGFGTGDWRIRTLPPMIWKPEPLWSGKQVISTVLMNLRPSDLPGINMISKNKIKNEYWGVGSNENQVIFKNGELLCGTLDKSQYGSSKYGIIHAIHETYGADTAGRSLSTLGRLFTVYENWTAFTCGMDDLELTPEGDAVRNKILSKAQDAGRQAAAEVTNLPEDTKNGNPEFHKRLEEVLRDEDKHAILDAVSMSKVNAITSECVEKCVPGGTRKKFPYSAMQLMALSGAKGSNVNVSQIMCLLGQQALEGRRTPVMVSGKTLPCFKPYDTDARAGGYIKNRFFSGIRPQEYYFHCMAGREGLIDTAVKTANSGYLQRCLTKQLEGVHVGYDGTVRNTDGSLVEFIYGGDDVDVTKESYMYKFDFFYDNYDALLQKYSPSRIDHLDAETAVYYSKKMRKELKKQKDLPAYAQSYKHDPTVSVYNPSRYLGSVSTRFEDELDNYIEANKEKFKKKERGISAKKFKALMQLKYMRSVIDPGEGVGIIAAESVGEPSTQMTLNTFHFAGHGAANVTLGIPRLREIVMTASASIKTPQMTLPLRKDVDEAAADSFCKSITKILLSEFIDDVAVVETTADPNSAQSTRSYEIQLKFFKSKEYRSEYDVTEKELEKVVSERFIKMLETEIAKEVRKQSKVVTEDISQAVDSSKADKVVEANANDDDDDYSSRKERTKSKQAASYDGPDEDELETMREAEKSDNEMDLDSSSDDSSSDSDSDDEASTKVAPQKKQAISKAQRDREQEVIIAHEYVTKYAFDPKGEWCNFKLELSGDTQKLLMVNIVEGMCNSCVVREVPHIGRCLHEQGSRDLVTEGVNFSSMWEHDAFIEVNKVRSNDVAAVLRTYGVEAARATIVNEILNVFGTYAIEVSSRHLDLLADYMTREGSYLAFNRQGIDSCTSDFMKMSYETTCQFLTKAVLSNDREELESPSARIVMGKLNKIGTGAFDLMSKMKA